MSVDICTRIRNWWDEEPIKSWFKRMEARYADMTLNGDMRRFFVARQGGTGSAWLAKVLNAHPDVFCSHEAIIAWKPQSTAYSDEDLTQLIESLALNSRHGAYVAAGDIGSAWVGHVVIAPSHLFSVGVLVRHPARMLRTRLVRARSAVGELASVDCVNIDRFFEVPVSGLSGEDALFLNDCLYWCVTAYCVPQPLIIRLEDISTSVFSLAALCRRLTGIEYSPQLLSSLMNTRVNVSAASEATIDDCLASFTPLQREWYGRFIEPAMFSAGYGEIAAPLAKASSYLDAAD